MKTCNACGVTKPFEEFYPAKGCVGDVAGTCKVCRNRKNEEWREAKLTDDPDWRKRHRDRRRLEALAQYSKGDLPQCSCCGETETAFLSFEHSNGGGNRHRKVTGGGGFISWLRAEHRDGIEVLCMNCNTGRRVNGGTCPHVEVVIHR